MARNLGRAPKRRNYVQVAPQQTAEVIPFPSAKVPEQVIEPEKRQSYEEVARVLGFKPAELVRAELLEFFEQEGTKLYDCSQVKAWLSDKKKKAKAKHWCWRPLREKDIITGYLWGYMKDTQTWDDGFYSSTSKSWECRPYQRLVPLHALEKVVKLEAKFGGYVKFFVSDYAVPDVDPFIMVRPAACDDGGDNYHLIFDAWDEPGFGE